MKWKLIKLNVDDLIENPRNAQTFNKEDLKNVETSIRKFGLADPLIINTDRMICGGHGRKSILKSMGVIEVDCYIPEKKLSPEDFDELSIRLNKNIAGEFDFDMLANNHTVKELLDYGFKKIELGIVDQFPGIMEDETDNEKESDLVHCPRCDHEFKKTKK